MTTIKNALFNLLEDDWVVTEEEKKDYKIRSYKLVNSKDKSLFGFSDASSKDVEEYVRNTGAFITIGNSGTIKSFGFLIMKNEVEKLVSKTEFYTLMECMKKVKNNGFIFSDSMNAIRAGKQQQKIGSFKVPKILHVRSHDNNSYNVFVDILAKMATYGFPEFSKEGWEKSLEKRYILDSDMELELGLHEAVPQFLKRIHGEGLKRSEVKKNLMDYDVDTSNWKPDIIKTFPQNLCSFFQKANSPIIINENGLNFISFKREHNEKSILKNLIFKNKGLTMFYVINEKYEIFELGGILAGNEYSHDENIKNIIKYIDNRYGYIDNILPYDKSNKILVEKLKDDFNCIIEKEGANNEFQFSNFVNNLFLNKYLPLIFPERNIVLAQI